MYETCNVQKRNHYKYHLACKMTQIRSHHHFRLIEKYEVRYTVNIYNNELPTIFLWRISLVWRSEQELNSNSYVKPYISAETIGVAIKCLKMDWLNSRQEFFCYFKTVYIRTLPPASLTTGLLKTKGWFLEPGRVWSRKTWTLHQQYCSLEPSFLHQDLKTPQ